MEEEQPHFQYLISCKMGFPCASVHKNLPEVQEMQVWILDKEDPLEEDMATHSSILAWGIPWTEKPGGLQSLGSQKVGQDWSNGLRMQAQLWNIQEEALQNYTEPRLNY